MQRFTDRDTRSEREFPLDDIVLRISLWRECQLYKPKGKTHIIAAWTTNR